MLYSKTLIDTLNNYGDRRFNIVGSSTVGFPYGLTRDNAVAFANANTNYARLQNPAWAQATSPVVVLGARMFFLQERKLRNLMDGENAIHYTTMVSELAGSSGGFLMPQLMQIHCKYQSFSRYR